VSILGRQLCVNGILAQDLVFVWGRFSGDSGDFRGRGGEGALSTICRCPAGVLEAHPGTPVPSALYSPSLLGLQGSILGVVGVSVDVIITY